MCNRHHMLKMRRGQPIGSGCGPAVIGHHHIVRAQIDHWLNREHHPLSQSRVPIQRQVIGHCGVFVQPAPDAVPDELPHHGKPESLDPALHRAANIAQASPGDRLFNALEQCLARHLEQFLFPVGNLADNARNGLIPVVPAQFRADIDADDIAIHQPAIAGNPVYHLLVDRNAGRGRIRDLTLVQPIALKRGFCAVGADHFFGHLVQFPRRYPRLNHRFEHAMHHAHDPVGFDHQLQFSIFSQCNHKVLH